MESCWRSRNNAGEGSSVGSFIRGEPDAIIRWAPTLILVGMALAFVSAQFEIPGLISSFYAIGLGASGGAMAKWRTERGLWMLAGLCLVLWGAIYGMNLYGEFHDALIGAKTDFGLVIDFCIATAILSTNLRFLWRVAQCNWCFSRQPTIPG
jgi:hypothetical protein